MHLNELLKVLGIGLTPASLGIVGYFLYRALIGDNIALRKAYTDLQTRFEKLQEELETAYMRRDVNEEKLRRLEDNAHDLQRQIDRLERERDHR